MSINDELEQTNRDAPTWQEFRARMIIADLRSGNPEPLIKFMYESGDMTQFSSGQLDVVAKALRGETLRERGRPEEERIRDRHVTLLFWVAWYSEIKRLPLTDPKNSKNTAFEKAVEAIGGGIQASTVKGLWKKCDKDYYRAAVRD